MSELHKSWGQMNLLAASVGENLSRLQVGFKRDLVKEVKLFVVDSLEFRADWEENGPMVPGVKPLEAVERLKDFKQTFEVGMWYTSRLASHRHLKIKRPVTHTALQGQTASHRIVVI